MSSEASSSTAHPAVNTVIRIHYDPPEGAVLGVRCGGEGNDWHKFYYATKKGSEWVCNIPMMNQAAPVEFKPVLQYNAPNPPTFSPHTSTFNFSSPDLRKSFLSSSSSALFKTQSQADFGDLKPAPSPNLTSNIPVSLPSPKFKPTNNRKDSLRRDSLRKDSLRKDSLRKNSLLLMSPLRPSSFSVQGESDESYAVGANYITHAGRPVDVYPWFYNWQGTVEVVENVASKILSNERDVIVYLPPSYNENKLKRYPVMIMQDAHNLFYEHLSFAGRVWKIPFCMDELCASGVITETIIVAITPVKREYEYLPPTPDGRADGGGADLYLDFIGKELKPIINTKYRTDGDYGIAGSSYGGIISLYAWLTRPEEYSKCGCYSPSLKWHNKYMFSVARQAIKQLHDTHKTHLLYLDAGTENDQLLATVKMARQLEKTFSKNANKEKKRIHHETTGKTRAAEVFDKLIAVTGIHDDFGVRNIETVQTVGAILKSGKVMLNVGQGHSHCEDSWAKRTPLALSFLLRDKQRESRWVKEVVEDISQRILD